jgi:hypothetical protein
LALKEESEQEEKKNIQVPKNHDFLHLSHEDEYLSISIPSDSGMDEESKHCGGGGLCNSFISSPRRCHGERRPSMDHIET